MFFSFVTPFCSQQGARQALGRTPLASGADCGRHGTANTLAPRHRAHSLRSRRDGAAWRALARGAAAARDAPRCHPRPGAKGWRGGGGARLHDGPSLLQLDGFAVVHGGDAGAGAGARGRCPGKEGRALGADRRREARRRAGARAAGSARWRDAPPSRPHGRRSGAKSRPRSLPRRRDAPMAQREQQGRHEACITDTRRVGHAASSLAASSASTSATDASV